MDIAQMLDATLDWCDRHTWVLRLLALGLVGLFCWTLMPQPAAAALSSEDVAAVRVTADESPATITYAVSYECKTGTTGRLVTNNPFLHLAVMQVFTGLTEPSEFMDRMASVSADDAEFARNFLTACMGLAQGEI